MSGFWVRFQGRHLNPVTSAKGQRTTRFRGSVLDENWEFGADGVTFRVKNHRVDGAARYTTMTLAPADFIRRVLLHVLPKGFHPLRQGLP